MTFFAETNKVLAAAGSPTLEAPSPSEDDLSGGCINAHELSVPTTAGATLQGSLDSPETRPLVPWMRLDTIGDGEGDPPESFEAA